MLHGLAAGSVLSLVVWSLAIAGMGFVAGLASLFVMRGLLGIAQAGAYATTTKLIPLGTVGVVFVVSSTVLGVIDFRRLLRR